MDILKVVEWVYVVSGIAAAIYVWVDIRTRSRARDRARGQVCGQVRGSGSLPAHILWTVFALICPVLCLIIYLLLRDEEGEQATRVNLATQVKQAPQVTGMEQAGASGQGAQREVRCPSCGYFLDEEWRFCPMCRSEIPKGLLDQAAAYADGKENMMGEKKWSMRLTFIVVVLAPVIICLIIAGQLLPSVTQTAGLVQSGNVEVMSSDQNMESAELKGWIAQCSQASDNNVAYMMMQSVEDEDENRYMWDYLVLYVKGPVDMVQKDGIDYGIGKRTFRMETVKSAGDGTEGFLVMGRFKHIGDVENRVTIDGKQVEIRATEPEFDLIKVLREEWNL